MMIAGQSNMRAFRLVMLQRAMSLELRTGIKASRHHNPFDIVRKQLGITTRSKQKVYDLFVAALPRLIAQCNTDGQLDVDAVANMADVIG